MRSERHCTPGSPGLRDKGASVRTGAAFHAKRYCFSSKAVIRDGRALRLLRRAQSFRLRSVDKALTGAAGEFFVAAELARRGWRPSITPRGVERTDVLAQNSESGRVVALQVKTATTNVFRLGLKDEQPAHAQDEWFVLVTLGEEEVRPRYFVLPTNVIAGWLYVEHRVWLSGTKRDGAPRKDTPIRAIRMNEIDAVYEEGWDLLNAPADNAPVRVPERILEGASGIDWPDGHPGLSALQ